MATQTAKATEEISAQIAEIQNASAQAVTSTEHIGNTISRINEISGAIAAAVEQQSAATSEIARNIDQAATGTSEVSANITNISHGVSDVSSAAAQVLSASGELSQKGESMRTEVGAFLNEVRKVV